MKVLEEMKRENGRIKVSFADFLFCRKEVCYNIHYLLTIIYRCFVEKGYKDY